MRRDEIVKLAQLTLDCEAKGHECRPVDRAALARAVLKLSADYDKMHRLVRYALGALDFYRNNFRMGQNGTAMSEVGGRDCGRRARATWSYVIQRLPPREDA